MTNPATVPSTVATVATVATVVSATRCDAQ